MLVFSRNVDQDIIIADNIVVRVLGVRGNKVRIGIEADPKIPVHRKEVKERIDRENAAKGVSP